MKTPEEPVNDRLHNIGGTRPDASMYRAKLRQPRTEPHLYREIYQYGRRDEIASTAVGPLFVAHSIELSAIEIPSLLRCAIVVGRGNTRGAKKLWRISFGFSTAGWSLKHAVGLWNRIGNLQDADLFAWYSLHGSSDGFQMDLLVA